MNIFHKQFILSFKNIYFMYFQFRNCGKHWKTAQKAVYIGEFL